MNIGILLSGGVGKRLGAKIPKQYLDLCGKPIIQYALEAICSANSVDEVILVIDSEYLSMINFPETKKIHIVTNGKERLNSVENALEFIKENLPNTENIIITQAVQPFITSDLIDLYLKKLNEYDVVVTAEKCVGEIFNIKKYEKIDRNSYYFCQSPEAFRFKDLYKNLDVNSEYTELIYHYPNEPKIYYHLGVTNNLKLTYESDLEIATIFMNKRKKEDKSK